MSFSSDTKIALTREVPEKHCCLRAMLAGMLFFSASQDDGILFQTEAKEVSDVFETLLFQSVGLSVNTRKSGPLYKTALTHSELKKHKAELPFGKPIKSLLSCENCGAAFFRGAFLASGFVNPPEKPARLELATYDADLACDTAAALTSHFRLPKLSVRRGKQILYYRDAESVEYFLSYIGANKSAFEMINAQMFKEKRNEINRKANFEFANITKTVSAAAVHTEAIRALIKSGDIEKLSPELRRTARLRLENDTMTLAELANLEDPPISKSQVSKRLQKIYDFYRSQNKQNSKGES